MAIVQETMEINGTAFVRTDSDAGRYVVRDGVSYSEAYDPASFGRVYTEGEPMSADEIAAQAEEILDILMGGGE